MKILLIGGGGYIGSRLYADLPKIDTTAIDAGWHGPVPFCTKRDYATLTKEELRGYAAVILLAGHSSVASCKATPTAARLNNVENFRDLVIKLQRIASPPRLIYASSGSVYGNFPGDPASEDATLGRAASPYDAQKREIDLIAKRSGLDYYGLRFGTVCGFSPHLRVDLMINAMFYSAKNGQGVKVVAPETRRAILSAGDLCSGIAAILDTEAGKPGIYNLSSFNSTAGAVGEKVAAELGAACEVEIESQPPAYDFWLDCSKFQSAFHWRPAGTVATITRSLVADAGRIKWQTRRDQGIYYKGRG